MAEELELLRSGIHVGGSVLSFQLGTRPVDVVTVSALEAGESGDGLEPYRAEVPVHGGRHDAGLTRAGDRRVQSDVAGVRAVVRRSQAVIGIT